MFLADQFSLGGSSEHLHYVHFMPAVHSRRVQLASATLYTLAKSSQFWRATRANSQARHEAL